MNVQAVINNVSFPKELDTLRHYVFTAGHFDMESILSKHPPEWTMPKWAVPNDIVFFYHAKTAIASIRRLEAQLRRENPPDREPLQRALYRARAIYSRFGGKIFAIGRVQGVPFYDNYADENPLHWSSSIFAPIGEICLLDDPVALEEFSDFIFLSRQSAITAVLGSDFDRLKEIISRNNPLPAYVIQSRATPLPLRDIHPQNWLRIAQIYRRSFFLEIQFRRYFVDYLLSSIGDTKGFYSECACYRSGALTGCVDNCIRLNRRLCAVEVKLNVHAVSKIEVQLKKYCDLDEIELGKRRCDARLLMPDRVMVIDREALYFYEARSDRLLRLIDLDSLQSEADLPAARRAILRYLDRQI